MGTRSTCDSLPAFFWIAVSSYVGCVCVYVCVCECVFVCVCVCVRAWCVCARAHALQSARRRALCMRPARCTRAPPQSYSTTHTPPIIGTSLTVLNSAGTAPSKTFSRPNVRMMAFLSVSGITEGVESISLVCACANVHHTHKQAAATTHDMQVCSYLHRRCRARNRVPGFRCLSTSRRASLPPRRILLPPPARAADAHAARRQ